jgi:hypothetical protein
MLVAGVRYVGEEEKEKDFTITIEFHEGDGGTERHPCTVVHKLQLSITETSTL